ncbi:hypothetical protein [Methanocella arvoryzae]|uniref:Oxidoreductase molybdopterin-binding domain-containing protein n=1 Tax=Methanocella arvoryzae (strain DSM 22066 / NBRC 105507 / MRE50) TaxID=351160 RepID=Q0W8J2_METAR|nr:hypothetical protein [Methanocella arvoryzae]CAJ35301.1 hypothetical protein LRC328 [Methanocella arvoryzae MRE50]
MISYRVSTIVTVVLVLVAAAALSGCTSSGTADNAGGLKSGLPDTMDFSIEITGGTTSPVTVTYEDMKAMEFKELLGIYTVNSVGTESIGDYIGVPLPSIVAKAGLPEGEISYKIAASDGYNLVYTSEQLEKSIVAFKKNGTVMKPNINDKNSIIIVVPNETNNMWMKMPAKIEIIKGSAAEPALSVTGLTDNKLYLSLDDLRALPQVSSSYVDKKSNETVAISGPSLNALLDSAAIQSGALEAVFTGKDGYNKSISLADIRADPNALITIGEDGSLKNYVADQPSGTRVSDLVTIKIV